MCGVEKKLDDYYATTSPFHKYTQRVSICKSCLWDYVNADDNENVDLNKICDALRMIDKPFIIDLWKASAQEARKVNKSIFKLYMKNLWLKHNRDLTWNDSVFDGHKKSDNVNELNFDDEESISKEELKALINFFGEGFSVSDYIWLRDEYEDFMNRYECDSKGMELLIKEICLTMLDIKKRRANGEKVDQQLKTLQDLLGSSNLKPVQETGANAVEQETFGTLIKKYEKERPIPEPDPVWKDVDGIGKYIRTFFFGHMARALGIENKYKDEYEEEMNKYTVTQEEIDGEE